jgi:tetratricopeptide (TPR) repeat protein
LAGHGATLQAQVLAEEALLLVESNQAIQFEDLQAAQRLAQTAEALWQRELKPDRDLDAATVSRIQRNVVRRITQLCRQAFVREAQSPAWPALAIALAQNAVRRGPYDESLHYVLGELMLTHATGQAVVDFFLAELPHDLKPQTSHYFIAMGLMKLADDDAALQNLQHALQIDPAHEMSQRQWGLLLERQGQLVPALQHLVEATRIHPEYRAALLDVARLADRLGRPEQAEQWRARARAAPSNSPRRFVYWARYLQQHGRSRAALTELGRRLQEAPDDQEALELRQLILASGTSQ